MLNYPDIQNWGPHSAAKRYCGKWRTAGVFVQSPSCVVPTDFGRRDLKIHVCKIKCDGLKSRGIFQNSCRCKYSFTFGSISLDTISLNLLQWHRCFLKGILGPFLLKLQQFPLAREAVLQIQYRLLASSLCTVIKCTAHVPSHRIKLQILLCKDH